MESTLQRQVAELSSFSDLDTKLEHKGLSCAKAGIETDVNVSLTASASVGTQSEAGALAPPPPSLPAGETGLPFNFLVDLALKTLFHAGRMRLWAMSTELRLPVAVVEPLLEFMRHEKLCEVAQPDPSRPTADVSFQLSAAGQVRAETALKKSQYVGPAPVSREAYVEQVERQSRAQLAVTREDLGAALSGLAVQHGLAENLGAALNSGRPMLIYGPSGSGKTYIAEHLVNATNGHIYVPHAILVDGDVIQIFDPLVHRPVSASTAKDAPRPWNSVDRRWVLCRRPVVMSGGELTLSALDLQFDAHNRFYVAPPQVKANNGLYIIDDLGRQQISPQDLMNRWIVPLDRRVDHFALHTGKQFRLPFHLSVIFSSNLRPADLADEAFLRRLGYKIYIGEMSAENYRAIFIQACERTSLPYSETAFRYLLNGLHAIQGKPLLACVPFDLVSMVRDRATFEGRPPELSVEALNWAWNTYFAVA